MKNFTFTLLSFFVFSVTATAQADTFTQRFQSVFTQSIKGLDAMKGAAAGSGWECTTAFPEFAESRIVKDETIGVFALRLSFFVMDEEAGKESMPRLEAMISAALPAGDYTRTQTYGGENYVGYMKTVYEFNSEKMAEKEKRPSVQIGAIKSGDKIEVVILLFEPFFKNQYQPKF